MENMKGQANILCVVVEPNKPAELRSVDYEYEYEDGEKELAQFETLKKIIGTDMGEFLSYPIPGQSHDHKIYVLGDEDGRVARDAKLNRNGYWGTVVIVGRGRSFGSMISLTKEQSQNVIREMNKRMPTAPLTDGNRRA